MALPGAPPGFPTFAPPVKTAPHVAVPMPAPVAPWSPHGGNPIANITAAPLEPETFVTQILLDTGPSENGWHGHESELVCDQLTGYKDAGVEFPESDPLVRGTLLHVGLAHLYARRWCVERGQDPDAYYTPAEAIQLAANRHGTSLYLDWVPRCQQAVREYVKHWAREEYEYEVVEVERVVVFPAGTLIPDMQVALPVAEAEQRALIARGIPPEHAAFRATVIPGRNFTARIDLVLRHRATGGIYVIDHKGTASINETVPQRYVLSGQFLGLYHFGVAIWGDAFKGVIPNLIGFRKGTSFARPSLDPAPWALTMWPDSVRQAHKRRELARLEGIDPWQRVHALSEHTCIGPYGKCRAFELCRWGKLGLGPTTGMIVHRSGGVA